MEDGAVRHFLDSFGLPVVSPWRLAQESSHGLSGCLMWQPASTRATTPTESGAGDAAFFPSGLAGREVWISHSATFALLHWPKPVLVILILRALHSQ